MHRIELCSSSDDDEPQRVDLGQPRRSSTGGGESWTAAAELLHFRGGPGAAWHCPLLGSRGLRAYLHLNGSFETL